MVRAVLIGMLVMLAGTIPRNLFFAANLRHEPGFPWAIPVTFVYVWLFWRYLAGAGPPQSTSHYRRSMLRANRLPPQVWWWALVSGSLGIAVLFLTLGVVNRLM